MEFTDWDTRVAVHAVIIDSRNRLLLTWYNGSRPHPQWTLPGGGVDFDESIDEALTREVLEETGYEVELGQILTTSTWTSTEGPRPPRPYKSVRIVFTATVVGGSLGTTEVGGTTDFAEWIPLDQLPETGPRAHIVDVAMTALRSTC